MHMGGDLAELGPGLPPVLDQVDTGYAVEHGAHGVYDGIAAAFRAAGGDPQLEICFQAAGNAERSSGRTHEILQGPGCAEGSDAQSASGEGRPRYGRGVDVVEIR